MSHGDQSRVLEELNAQIANLRASESELLRRLTEIRSNVTRLEVKRGGIMNSNAPIHSLPDDIFLHIVKIGLELDKDSNDPESLHHEPFQSLVARVSRRWLMMALDAPLLWTRIRCRPIHRFSLERLEAFLMRSQRCSLDITFNISDVTNHSHPEISTRVRCAVTMLVGHADRWQSFTVLAGSPAYLSYTLKALRRIHVPRLERFAVEKHFIEDLRPVPSNFGIFTGGTPTLACLSLHDCNGLIHYLPSLMHITRLQLSYFTHRAKFPQWQDLQQALVMLPSLLHLSIPHYVTQDMRGILMSIELASLLTLEISSPNRQELYSFVYKLCTSLSTPSLDTLILNQFGTREILDLVQLSRDKPISLRYPVLRALKIRWGPLIQLDVIKEFVHAFANITHLTMWSDSNDDHFDVFMKQLIEDARQSLGPDALWPHLQSVTLQSPFATDLGAVAAMISARSAAGQPVSQLILERVAWKWRRAIDQPAEAHKAPSSRHLDQIQELRKMVNLEVRSGRTDFQAMDVYGMWIR